MIKFAVSIEPVAKGRPRFCNGRVITPAKTRAFEAMLGLVFKLHKPKELLLGPLDVTLVFQLVRPKSSKRKYPSVKPDLDNFLKAVLDSGNGIFWKDDAQVVSLKASKQYGPSPWLAVDIKQLQE